MVYAKVFKSGNSQAIRIPKEFRFCSDEVEIIKRNNELIVREKPKTLVLAFKLMTQMPNDYFEEGRCDNKPQERDPL